MKSSTKIQAASISIGGKCKRRFKLAATLATIAALSIATVTFAGPGSGSGGGGGGNILPPPPVTTTTAQVAITSPILPAQILVGDAQVTINYALINTGTIPLQITSLVLQDFSQLPGTPSLFTFNTGTCIGGTSLPTGTGTLAVPTGANVCRFSVTFNPAVAGADGALVNLTFANAPSTNTTTGNTVVLLPRPVLNVTASATLSSIPVNSVTTPQADLITLQNFGGLPLTINSATFGGANPGDFVLMPIVQNLRAAGNITSCTLFGTLPISLPYTLRCGYNIGFKPTAEGPRSATFTVTTNDPAQPTVSFIVAGNASAPTFQPVLSAFNVSGLWTNPAETDWSLSIAHHQRVGNTSTVSDAVIATFATFDANGVPTWFTIKNGSWTGTPANVVTFSTTYTGEVHKLTGNYFADPFFDPARIVDSVVGTATLSFTNASSGTLSFNINGVQGQQIIVPAAF